MRHSKKDLYRQPEKAAYLSPKDKNGEFFDLPEDNRCKDKEHTPPGYMVIPHGKGYRHVCPTCGHVTIVIPTQISLEVRKKKNFKEVMDEIVPFLPKESIMVNPKYIWESETTKSIPYGDKNKAHQVKKQ